VKVSRSWILFIILIAVLTIALFGCTAYEPPETKEEREAEEDYSRLSFGGAFVVYSFQGHDYVANISGGILHSESCPGDHR